MKTLLTPAVLKAAVYVLLATVGYYSNAYHDLNETYNAVIPQFELVELRLETAVAGLTALLASLTRSPVDEYKINKKKKQEAG